MFALSCMMLDLDALGEILRMQDSGGKYPG